MDNINLQTKKIFLYARDHFVKNLTPRFFGGFAFHKFTDNIQVFLFSKFSQFNHLRLNGKHWSLWLVRGVTSIEKNEAEGILAWHPDRLARNSIDGGRIIYLVDTGKITTLKFPTFWFDPTPPGKFMWSIAFGQSKYYVDNLSENIKRGIRQKLRNGIW
ncbi:MAG: recombinase family protein, partial [Patescibacteria group bacterium]